MDTASRTSAAGFWSFVLKPWDDFPLHKTKRDDEGGSDCKTVCSLANDLYDQEL